MEPNGPIVTITQAQADSLADNFNQDLLGLRAPTPGLVEPRVNDLDELEKDLQNAAGQSPQAQLGKSSCQQPNDLLAVQTAPIRGRGVPLIPRTPISQQATSVVTDLGYQLHSRARRRTNSDKLGQEYDSRPGHVHRDLHKVMIHSGVCGRRFLPYHRLPELVNRESVEAELKRFQSITKRIQTLFAGGDSDEELAAEAHKICGTVDQSWRSYAPLANGLTVPHRPMREKTYRKIFTILLLIQRPSRIRHFVEEGVCDADLPLQIIPTDKRFGGKPWTLGRKSKPDVALRCFAEWRFVTVRTFEETQWSVIAPFLGQDDRRLALRYRIPDHAVLPFEECVPQQRGGSGVVFRVKIHPSHHDFDNILTHQASEKHVFAVKCLKSRDEQAFRHEFDILRTISKNPHDHLITLLAAYEYRGYYHLIFPWATHNLLGYWQDPNNVPENEPATACWLAEQCEGLANGLATINKYPTLSNDSMFNRLVPGNANTNGNLRMTSRSHSGRPHELHCRHGDIKPENILWFPNRNSYGTPGRGTLKIADFGTAEVNTTAEIKWKASETSPIYRPPEAHPRLSDSVRYHSYDIWGLACVFLEFVTWYFGGWDSIKLFEDKRLAIDTIFYKFHIGTFFEVYLDEAAVPRARVKPAVHEFVDQLRRDRQCTHFFHEFLDLICTEMLIVEEGNARRTGAANISARIADMVNRGKQDDKYFSEPCRCCGTEETVP